MPIEKRPSRKDRSATNKAKHQGGHGGVLVSGETYRQKFGPGRGVGRPTRFTPETITGILERMATGQSIATVCEDPAMPDRETVFGWLYKAKKGIEPFVTFKEAFEEARQYGTDAIVEDIFGIADDGHNDWMEKHYGGQTAWVVNGEAVGRSKLRVESRMWYLAKINPRQFGDKVDVTSGGEKLPTPIMGGAAHKPEVIEGQIVEQMGHKKLESTK